MKRPHHPTRPFRSAKEEVKKRLSREDRAAQRLRAFRLAFSDDDFLLRKELRPIRLQLELLKPELCLHDEDIDSTIVFFGSARIFEPEIAHKRVTDLKAKIHHDPTDLELRRALKIAEKLAERSVYYEEARAL